MKINNLNLKKVVSLCKKSSLVLIMTTTVISFCSCDNSIDEINEKNIITYENDEIIIDYEDEKIIEKEIESIKVDIVDEKPAAVVIEEEKPAAVVIEEEKPEIKTVTLISLGDNLIHGSVYKSGKQEDGTYNYDSFFRNIQDEINWADLKVINQETMLVSDESEYSGYPTFGSPYAIGEAIADAGFNVVLHATNHTYDKGLTGIKDTLSFWDKYKDHITVLGIHKSKDDFEKINVIEKNGVKFAMLNYTYGLNGFKLPSDKEYLVDTLYDIDKVINDIKKANEIADVVIAFPHWGNEYVYEPSKNQVDLAHTMADAGADLIIGTHPHVVEPLVNIETSDGRIVPVYYSLGNFISSQDKMPRMLGAMAQVTITSIDGLITIDAQIKPLVTHNKTWTSEYTAYMLEDYTESLANSHRLSDSGLTLENLENLWNDIIVEEKEKVLTLK